MRFFEKDVGISCLCLDKEASIEGPDMEKN